MKIKKKLFLFSIGALAMISPLLVIASCQSNSPSSEENQKPTEPNNSQQSETVSKGSVPKESFGFAKTVEDNSYKINKEWIFQNKMKLLNGNTSLFSSKEDILELSAKPSANDETKLTISFKLAAGKSLNSDKAPTNSSTLFEVQITNFEQPTRTLETLSNLLLNHVSTKIKAKEFNTEVNKYIDVNWRPDFGQGIEEAYQNWFSTKFQNNQRKIKFIQSSSTLDEGITVLDGWNEQQANSVNSDIWNWFDNISIPEGNIFAYTNELLKTYKYLGDNSNITNIKFYWGLVKEKKDETTNSGVHLYRWTIAPLGWGLQVNDNNVPTNVLQDNIKIPENGELINQTYDSSQNNSVVNYKFRKSSFKLQEETIDFEPNFTLNYVRYNGLKVDQHGGVLGYKSSNKDLVIPTQINIGNSNIEVKQILDRAFQNSDIKSVFIPNTITYIGDASFSSSQLNKITFESNSSLETIAGYAFDNCTNLTGELVIPNSVTSIGQAAFRKTTFNSLKFEENSKLTIINTYAFHQSKIAGKLVIPRSVKTMKNWSFKETLITSLVFEENSSITTIGNSAFFSCQLEGVIELPRSLETLDKWTFQSNRIEKIIGYKDFPYMDEIKDENTIYQLNTRI